MVTLKEIAQMCGVTTSTVSNVLNNKPKVGEATRKKVLEAVEKTGYQPNYFAQVIRKTKTNVIGIVTEDLNEFSTIRLWHTVRIMVTERFWKICAFMISGVIRGTQTEKSRNQC